MIDVRKELFKSEFKPEEVLEMFPDAKIPNHGFHIELSEGRRFTAAVEAMSGGDDDELSPVSRFVDDLYPSKDGGIDCCSVVLTHPEDAGVIGYYTVSFYENVSLRSPHLAKIEGSLDVIFVDDGYRGFGYSTVLAASATQLISSVITQYKKSVMDPDILEVEFSYDAISTGGQIVSDKIEQALDDIWFAEEELALEAARTKM